MGESVTQSPYEAAGIISFFVLGLVGYVILCAIPLQISMPIVVTIGLLTFQIMKNIDKSQEG